MSIYECSINTKNKCYGCKYLNLDEEGVFGTCECTDNKVKNRQRYILDRACSFKI